MVLEIVGGFVALVLVVLLERHEPRPRTDLLWPKQISTDTAENAR